MKTLKAEDAVYGGYVISRNDGIVFIRGAIPGEMVEVSISEKKRDYSIASVMNVLEPSDYRIDPPCPHFGECGGCQLQYAAYEKQIEMKNQVLRDCLSRIGSIDAELSPHIAGGQFNYRRRAQFKVSKERSIGFYREGTRVVISISSCLLLTQEINTALRTLRDMDIKGVKEMHITHGDSMVALIKGRGFDEGLAEELINAGFSGAAFEDGSYRGSGYVSFDMNGLSYTVSPWSFFQSNWSLNVEVVRVLNEELGDLEGKNILDMYAGAGNFSLPLAASSAEVTAIEGNTHSIKDGQRNISLNKIKKFRFLSGMAEKIRVKKNFDIIILDPPRPGLSNEAMRRVIELSPRRIAYVSCNPSTFARDLRKLKEIYEIQSIRLIDMFPNTYHVESLAFLQRKESIRDAGLPENIA